MPGPDIIVHFHINNNSILKVLLFPNKEKGLAWDFFSQDDATGDAKEIKSELNQWMEKYAKRIPQGLPSGISLEGMPLFSRHVLEKVAEIPMGKTKSYGEIAIELEKPNAARAVGGGCGRNPFPLLIPATGWWQAMEK